jgi:hypothetical protein
VQKRPTRSSRQSAHRRGVRLYVFTRTRGDWKIFAISSTEFPRGEDGSQVTKPSSANAVPSADLPGRPLDPPVRRGPNFAVSQ